MRRYPRPMLWLLCLKLGAPLHWRRTHQHQRQCRLRQPHRFWRRTRAIMGHSATTTQTRGIAPPPPMALSQVLAQVMWCRVPNLDI
jgi:hypothetical protein